MEQIVFPVPSICEFLTKESKLRIYYTTERDEQGSKINDFFLRSEDLFNEMNWQKKLRGGSCRCTRAVAGRPHGPGCTAGMRICKWERSWCDSRRFPPLGAHSPRRPLCAGEGAAASGPASRRAPFLQQ